MHLIDTHCHLSFPDFDTDRADVLSRASLAEVVGILNVATEPGNWTTYLQHARETKHIFIALGIHPNSAQHYSEEALNALKDLVERERGLVKAIGETGLDYYRESSPQATQLKSLQAQLELAEELKLPLILHCREAEEALCSLLEAHTQKTGSPLRGVWHCFTADMAYLERALALGLYLGFGGVTTYKKAENVRNAVRATPLDRILIETDAPFLAPLPYRSKRNEPAYIVETARLLADLKALPVYTLANRTAANARSLFNAWY